MLACHPWRVAKGQQSHSVVAYFWWTVRKMKPKFCLHITALLVTPATVSKVAEDLNRIIYLTCLIFAVTETNQSCPSSVQKWIEDSLLWRKVMICKWSSWHLMQLGLMFFCVAVKQNLLVFFHQGPKTSSSITVIGIDL